MTELLTLNAQDLTALATALRTKRLAPPYSPARIQNILAKTTAAAIAPGIQQLADRGFTPEQISLTLDLLAQSRASQSRMEDDLELVTTGPDALSVDNRDTSVVVRDLFANAQTSVLVAGYAVFQGQRVFQALADRMHARPELQVRLFLDIQRGPGDTSVDGDVVKRFLARFRAQQWPTERPLPPIYYDPRSLVIGTGPKACLHAKCVVVDQTSVFVSSANFTQAAQERNVEVGLLVTSPSTAHNLSAFFDTLIKERLLLPAQ